MSSEEIEQKYTLLHLVCFGVSSHDISRTMNMKQLLFTQVPFGAFLIKSIVYSFLKMLFLVCNRTNLNSLLIST